MNVLWRSHFGLLKDHSVLWKSYFGLLRDHFGQCAVEELLWATQGSLWPACCGRATLGYSGTTLLLWATQGGLWGVCCGRATLGYSGITLASVLWKSYFGLLRDHSEKGAVEGLLWVLRGQERVVERLLWATQGSLWPVCCGRATLGYSGRTLGSVLWKSYFGLLRDHSGECAVEDLL